MILFVQPVLYLAQHPCKPVRYRKVLPISLSNISPKFLHHTQALATALYLCTQGLPIEYEVLVIARCANNYKQDLAVCIEHLESGRAMFSKKAPISRILMT